MTREDIEKELQSCLDEPDNEWDSIFNSGFSRGFMKAANWRINSVWHDASEHPITGEEALVKHITGDGEIKYRVDVFCGYEWKEMCHYDKLIQFAYVKDLIQNMEE